MQSNLVRSACKLNISTVPRNEATAYVLAVRLLQEFLSCPFRELELDKQQNLLTILVGDSQAAHWHFLMEGKDVVLKNSIGKMKQHLLHILNNIKV